jgi:hypothetical protein
LPSDPVAAVSLLLVNGMLRSGFAWSAAPDHRPPDSGLVA